MNKRPDSVTRLSASRLCWRQVDPAQAPSWMCRNGRRSPSAAVIAKRSMRDAIRNVTVLPLASSVHARSRTTSCMLAVWRQTIASRVIATDTATTTSTSRVVVTLGDSTNPLTTTFAAILGWTTVTVGTVVCANPTMSMGTTGMGRPTLQASIHTTILPIILSRPGNITATSPVSTQPLCRRCHLMSCHRTHLRHTTIHMALPLPLLESISETSLTMGRLVSSRMSGPTAVLRLADILWPRARPLLQLHRRRSRIHRHRPIALQRNLHRSNLPVALSSNRTCRRCSSPRRYQVLSCVKSCHEGNRVVSLCAAILAASASTVTVTAIVSVSVDAITTVVETAAATMHAAAAGVTVR